MQYTGSVGDRPNISEQVIETLRRMICDGRLPAGSRVNEVQLSKKIGVSRTPLREALMGLVCEGVLISQPRRGFFVQELKVDEFESVYAVRQLLDPEALRLSELPSQQKLNELTELNELMRHELSADQAIELDDKFHLELLSGCPNPVLLDLIRQFMGRTRRYEYAYMRHSRSVSTAYDQHVAIIKCLKNADKDGACEALRLNLTSGIKPIRKWLEHLNREKGFNT